jgi:transcriptional regulator with XRE-family HTH domain
MRPQREVARRIGVNESTYRQWEYGTTLSGEPYPKIAEAFGITLDELFGLTKNPRETPEEEVERIISELNKTRRLR